MRIVGWLLALLVVASSLVSCADEDLGAFPRASTPVPTSEPRELAPGLLVDFWESPQPGWVLVVDGDPDYDEAAAWRLLLIDPATGELHGRLETGYWPHATVSPDESVLFVDSDSPAGSLAAVRFSDLEVLWHLEGLRPSHSNPPRAPVAALMVSRDGTVLYQVTLSTVVRAFDAESGALRGVGLVNSCSAVPSLWPGNTGTSVYISDCGGDPYRGDVAGDEFTVAYARQPLGLDEPRAACGGTVRGSSGRTLAVTRAGRLVEVDENGRGSDLGSPLGDSVADLPLVPLVISEDGRWLLLPMREDTRNSGYVSAGALHRVELGTRPASVASYERPNGISYVATGLEGAEIYVLDRDARELIVLDGQTLTEVRSFSVPHALMPVEVLVLP